MKRGVVAFALATSVTGCDACGRSPDATSTPSTTPSASTSTIATATSSSSASATTSPTAPIAMTNLSARLPCRAIGTSGTITPPVASLLPREGWLALAAGAKLTAKDPRTTRETGFEGPARVRACVDDDEESWLLATVANAPAIFTSSTGAGEKPGAEEWVVTPFGVVRYAAAIVKIAVSTKRAEVNMANGTAHVWSGGAIRFAVDAGASDASAGGAPSDANDGWRRIDGQTRLELAPTGGAADTVEAAVERCRALAESARALAKAIASPDASLGDLAPRHVVARRAARAACAVARMRALSLPDDASSPGDAGAGGGIDAGRTSLVQSAQAADATWRNLGE